VSSGRLIYVLALFFQLFSQKLVLAPQIKFRIFIN